jgi:uncharacterized protein
MPMQYHHAVVTGASGGIGSAFARELAAGGADLLLVARRADRLERLAAEISDRYGVYAEILTADLGESSGLAEVADRITSQAGLFDLLVNSAGTLGRIAPLAQQNAADIDRSLALNTRSMVRLSHAALPGMLRHQRGGIINVSSVMAFLPSPGGATYSAAKAFVTSFSESVHGEVKDGGVHVTAVCPGSTAGTALHHSAGHRESGRLGRLLDAGDVARAALVAVAAGHPVCVPGADYQWRVSMSRVLPRGLVRARYYRRWGSRPPRAEGSRAS